MKNLNFLIVILILIQFVYGSKEKKNDENGPVKFEIIGDSSHLFLEEDFQKKEAIPLHNLSNHSSETNLSKKRTNSNNSQLECLKLNFTRETNIVRLVNGSKLTSILTKSLPNHCFLVLFYVPWCPFSAKLAPIYNALPRAFLNLDILAFDVSNSIGYNTKFGTSAVPMIILFQQKNVLAKFNYTHKNLDDYIEFVSNKTGFTPNKSITITELDLEGPVPTVPIIGYDHYLLISWIFLLFISIEFIINKTSIKIYLFRLIRKIVLILRPIYLHELNQSPQLQAINNMPHPHQD